MSEGPFIAALRRALEARPIGFRGELRARDGAPGPLRPASVLIPIFEAAGEPGIVLVKRSAHLTTHAGQIAFPGGRRDDGEDELRCALREAEEEIALSPLVPQVLGGLDRFTTITDFLVTPLVAYLPSWPLPLEAAPDEVEAILEVRVDALVAPGALRVFQDESSGAPREVNFFVVGDDVIWGATGAMLRQLLELARGQPLVPSGEVPWEKVRF